MNTDHSAGRGPGLYEVNGHDPTRRFLTNVWKIAGRTKVRRPGGSVLIGSAAWLLAALGAGLLVVSFAGQFQYIVLARHQRAASVIEAAMFDVGMIIFSLLALGLARAAKPARTERTLIMACSFGSAAMNYSAADAASPRSVIAYVAAPVFLAVVVDRVIAVIRRHVLGDDEGSAWTALGHAAMASARLAGLVLLYALRAVLAPRETARGLRRMVLDAAPVPRVIEVAAVPELAGPENRTGPEHDDPARQNRDERRVDEPDLTFRTKKEQFLYRYRQHPEYGVRSAASRVAGLIAPLCQLKPGTGRTYAYEECDRLEAASTRGAGGAP